MSKTIVVVGATGVQGGSVARTFANLPGWKVRGISRNPDSSAAKDLVKEGVEVVKADLDHKESLIPAFTGANLIYANTDFFIHFFTALGSKDDVLKGRSPQIYARDRETEQGVNIAEAAASPIVLETLELFMWSSLSDAREISKGKYTEAYHHDSKNEVIRTIKAKFPKLAERLSVLIVGHYVTNWQNARPLAPQKLADGSFIFKRPFRPDHIVALAVPQKDTGKFVEALSKAPVGTQLMGTSEDMTWPEYTEIWGRVMGVKTHHEVVSFDDFFAGAPKPLVDEMRDPWGYVNEYGYDGGDPSVVSPKQLGITGLTPIAQYIREEDWSAFL